MNPPTPRMGRDWSAPSVPRQAELSLSFHLSCLPTPTPSAHSCLTAPACTCLAAVLLVAIK